MKDTATYSFNPELSFVKDGYRGNRKIDGHFVNGDTDEKMPVSNALKWTFSRNPQRKEKRNENFKLSYSHIEQFLADGDYIVWLGHASFFIQIAGKRIVTDPCFFNLMPFTKRKTALPCSPDSLNQIDYLLISHDHRDHFDKKSVEILVLNNPDMEALIPLEGSRLFDGKKLQSVKRQEAGWYQQYSVTDSLRIVFLPAKHWGRRGLNDFNRTLWGSFLIIAKNKKIFFAGDTAYDGQMFKDIGDLFGDVDICMLPVGAYMPQYFMKWAHTNPEEAVQAFLDLNGKCFIPMHYGTYDLSDEPLGEPLRRLETYFSGDLKNNLKSLLPGELFYIR